MDDGARAEQDRLLEIMRNDLYVAVVSDVLDSIGLHDQAMDDRLRPLAPEMRLVGRAHTVMTADIYERRLLISFSSSSLNRPGVSEDQPA